jgi:DNA-cytosine methyltransferase
MMLPKIRLKKSLNLPSIRLKIPIQSPIISSNRQLKVLDLFCGCGGLSEGLEQAGLQVVCGIDHWDRAIETYKLNHQHLGLIKDLTQYGPVDFVNETGISKIDILVGGPPCQGFSHAGKRDHNDPRNSLFMEFVKYLDYFRPRAFLLENVSGILSMKTAVGEKCVDIIMSHLTKDYDCKYFPLIASDYGVPQNRKRVIFFGFRKDLITPSGPLVIIPPPRVLSLPDQVAIKSVLLLRDQVNSSYFLSQRAIDGINRRKAEMKDKGFGFGAQFVDFDRPCYTISARYYKDGSDALVKYSDNDIRRLTEHELQLIQSFPPQYQFSGNKREVCMQIGNAVACRFARHLGLHLISLLNQCI